MAARAAPRQLPAPAGDPLEVVSLRRPRTQPLGGAGDRRQTEDAGSALARALRGEVGHDAGGGLHPAGLRGEEVHHPAPQSQAPSAHRVRVERQPPLLVDVSPATEVAAEKDGTSFAVHAARGGRRVPQRRSEFDFANPRVVDRAGYGDEAKATCLAVTETLGPHVAPARDERGQQEACDVLDKRRPAADTTL